MSTQFTNRQWRLPNNENKDKQSNYSMDFDSASSDYISINNNTTLNSISDSVSISQWIKFSGTSQQYITSFGNDYGTNVINGKFYFVFRNTSNTQIQLASNSTINDDNWHHVVAVKTTSNITIYIDGVLDKTDTTGDVGRTSTRSNAIGALYDGSINFGGQIDGVAIYNYPLSSSQITTLYGSSSTGIGNPMSLSPKPVFYAPLGDQDAFNGSNYLVPNSSLKDYVFDFDGSNDYIDCGNVTSLNNLSAFSTSTWINYEGTISGASSHMFLSGGSASNNRFYVQLYSSNQIRYGYNGNTIVTTSSMSSGSWYNIVTVHNGTSLDVYLNGVKQNTSTVTVVAPSTNIGNSFQIGKYFALSSYYFNGQLSNAQIFNTALPATGSNSVETLYNNGSPLTSMSGFTSLVGWWKLDASATYDSSTTTWTIPDDSTNSNDGTSSGMTQANLVQSDLSFTSGYSPYAMNFDRASVDSITINADLSSYSSITVSTWAKFVSSTGFQYVFDAGTYNASGPAGIKLGISKLQTTNEIATYDGLTSHSTGVNVALNTWYHITVTHAGTTRKVYLNGSLIATFASGNLNLNAINYIGRFSINTNFMDGSISNVSIWNTDLTSAQVSEIYNEGVPSNLNNHSAYSNLVNWWQLGSNSSYTNKWICLDEKGTKNGESVNMGEDAIVDGVGSYANGLSSGMGGDEVIGDAPYSTANALSVNMDVEDRVTDTPS